MKPHQSRPMPAQITNEDVQLRALSARLRTMAGVWTRQVTGTRPAAADAPEGKAAMTAGQRRGPGGTRMSATDRETHYRLQRPRRARLTGRQERRIAHKAREWR